MSSASSRERTGTLGGPASVVETACPLDCPDACSLAVTVQRGKLITLDGAHNNPVTDGYICAKVRKFGERVYGPDRLLHPGVRKGRKGEGKFERVSWNEALELVAERMQQAKVEAGGASILPYW
jgi:anaerobic selenocysteine-containing dehydrogenase